MWHAYPGSNERAGASPRHLLSRRPGRALRHGVDNMTPIASWLPSEALRPTARTDHYLGAACWRTWSSRRSLRPQLSAGPLGLVDPQQG
jgi:hypothetical protein